MIYYNNINLVDGYSKKNSGVAAKKWQLAGFVVGEYVMTAYRTMGEETSGVGVYILKRCSSGEQSDIYVGYIIAHDESKNERIITKCPYIGLFEHITKDVAAFRYPSINKPCEIISFSKE